MKPSARRVLERLRQGPATTHDLMQADVGGGRFGGRIGELRALGFGIHEQRLPLPTRGSTYTLTFDVERAVGGCASGISLARPGVDLVPSGSLSTDGSLFDTDAFTERGGYKDAA